MAVWSKATAPSCYGHIFTLAFQPLYIVIYVGLVPWCNSNPMTASRAHPPEVPSVAGNTQANDILPSIGARGGVNCRITPGPHTKLFGGARHPPPPPANPLPDNPPIAPPSPPPPPPRGPSANS